VINKKIVGKTGGIMSKSKKNFVYICTAIFLMILCAVWYYIFFPPINIHAKAFWAALVSWMIVIIIVYGLLDIYVFATEIPEIVSSGKRKRRRKTSLISTFIKGHKICIMVGVIATLSIFICIVGGIIGSPIIRAKSYSKLMVPEFKEFETDILPSDDIKDIALMDTDSARILGNRKLGSLSELVSQYEVSSKYTQINVGNTPKKVSSLDYASFFKWLNNRDTGIPGYISVDPVEFTSTYVKLEKGMKYDESAFFNDNLKRHIQFKYPTKIIYDYYFEIDDEGNPWYICPVVTAKIGLFGGYDVVGAIICDPISGDCDYKKVDSIPKWVDRVYDGEILNKKYNWYGMYQGGFINSIIGQSGCVQTTTDYGYKTIEDDVWVYTGVTSVNGDESNVGFVMMNQRTSECRYYTVSGAEEYSAMAAAEGEVQEKGYAASFPSLINVGGVPTYIMVLKDKGGLVKMYAMVNVEQYNIVVTSTTQTGVMTAYKKALAEDESVEVSLEEKEKEITVADINYIISEGNTFVYIKDEDGSVYKQNFADNESLIKISVGDCLKVKYEEMEDGINYLTEYSFSLTDNSENDLVTIKQ